MFGSDAIIAICISNCKSHCIIQIAQCLCPQLPSYTHLTAGCQIDFFKKNVIMTTAKI